MDNLALLAEVCSSAERAFDPIKDSLLSTDEFRQEITPDLMNDGSTSLQLGSTLAQSFLESALNPKTVRQYNSTYRRWISFCQENNLLEVPADPRHVAACIALTASETQSVATVEKLCAAIAFEHRKSFLPSPTCHESISLLLRSIRLRFSVERRSKQPLTHAILRRMVDRHYVPEHGRNGLLAPIPLWRTIWRAHFEFYTLGQFDDIIRLRRPDVTLHEEPKIHLAVKFLGGKTDVYSEGGTRIVCAHEPSDAYCPIRLTQHYFRRLGETYSGFLVPQTCVQNGSLMPDAERQLSYSTALEDLRGLLTAIGYDATLFGEHSGKRGGATAAASAGLDVDSLQRLGQWRSSRMPSRYTDLDTNQRLKLSSHLLKKL